MKRCPQTLSNNLVDLDVSLKGIASHSGAFMISQAELEASKVPPCTYEQTSISASSAQQYQMFRVVVKREPKN